MIHRIGIKTVLCIALPVLGCSAPSLEPASGKIVFEVGNAFVFDGDSIEIRQDSNARSLAFGQIRPDGSFEIESLVDGVVRKGAAPGTYRVRIIVADDDYEHRALAFKSIHRKYLNFDTSDLKLRIPSRDVVLQLGQ